MVDGTIEIKAFGFGIEIDVFRALPIAAKRAILTFFWVDLPDTTTI